MQTLTHTFVRDLTQIGPFLSVLSGEDRVENLGMSNYFVIPTPSRQSRLDLLDRLPGTTRMKEYQHFTMFQEGPAIRTAIVTKEKCEPAGREFVSVCV